jgi:4-hydroxy-tetrahydrodipicolinate reductase
MIRVGVFGAAGRMGATVCEAVRIADDCELVAAVDPFRAGAPVEGTDLTVSASADALLEAAAEVVVDFTVLDAARENLRWCAAHDVHAVVGTTGFSADDLDELAELFAHSKANALIAPNFAIGAVLMMRFAEQAAPWFETAEIIELHHDRKVDAPSGTALTTAREMFAARGRPFERNVPDHETLPGTRGGEFEGISIHSVRLPGLVAHQEVTFGGLGQTLSIRHDTTGRESFIPGVLLAAREVMERQELVRGLEALVGLA